jgi:hypothetical protein
LPHGQREREKEKGKRQEAPTQIHLRRARLENHPLLTPVGVGKLNLSIQTTGAKEGGVEGVRAVGGHDDLGEEGGKEREGRK